MTGDNDNDERSVSERAKAGEISDQLKSFWQNFVPDHCKLVETTVLPEHLEASKVPKDINRLATGDVSERSPRGMIEAFKEAPSFPPAPARANSITALHQRMDRLEAKLDEVLSLLRPSP